MAKVWTVLPPYVDAEFPSLRGEGDLLVQDKLNLFKTMVYVKANILMCATHMTLKKDLFK